MNIHQLQLNICVIDIHIGCENFPFVAMLLCVVSHFSKHSEHINERNNKIAVDKINHEKLLQKRHDNNDFVSIEFRRRHFIITMSVLCCDVWETNGFHIVVDHFSGHLIDHRTHSIDSDRGSISLLNELTLNRTCLGRAMCVLFLSVCTHRIVEAMRRTNRQ